MRSTDLTREQIAALADRVHPILDYMRRLEGRMEEQGFPPDDELFAAVRKAHGAARDLYVELHYARCDGQVGRPSGERHS
jgi:hypothetical protein